MSDTSYVLQFVVDAPFDGILFQRTMDLLKAHGINYNQYEIWPSSFLYMGTSLNEKGLPVNVEFTEPEIGDEDGKKLKVLIKRINKYVSEIGFNMFFIQSLQHKYHNSQNVDFGVQFRLVPDFRENSGIENLLHVEISDRTLLMNYYEEDIDPEYDVHGEKDWNFYIELGTAFNNLFHPIRGRLIRGPDSDSQMDCGSPAVHFLGPDEVERLGRDYLFNITAYSIKPLENGGVMIRSTENIFDYACNEIFNVVNCLK